MGDETKRARSDIYQETDDLRAAYTNARSSVPLNLLEALDAFDRRLTRIENGLGYAEWSSATHHHAYGGFVTMYRGREHHRCSVVGCGALLPVAGGEWFEP